MRSWTKFCAFMLSAMTLITVVGCGGATSVTPTPTTFAISGSVTGYTGSGLVLQDNGGFNLAVSGNGGFVFTNQVANGGAYNVTVLTQPASPAETCTVTNGSGTATANVTNVAVVCTSASTTTYTIGGTVTEYTGTGLVLQDNLGNDLDILGDGSFTFTTAIASGGAYSVTVLTQPTGQTCSVSNGSGTATANVTNVSVACTTTSTTSYTIGGSVTGLTGTGLVLQDNLGNNLAVNASGSFTFSTAIASGSAYSVTVLTQPTGQTCSVSSGSGTASANVTNVSVACTTTTYTIGGTVSGLTGTGLVLQDNLGNNLAVSGSSFTFTTAIASGAGYSVTVLTQPSSPAQTCTVTNGSGTASANVTNVSVACTTPTYTIGGTVNGLTGSGLVLVDGLGASQTISANATSFSFTQIASGGAYSIAVGTQPAGQTCTVSNGAGTVGSANITNVVITCTTNSNPIVPYLAVNSVWNATPESSVTVVSGSSVDLGPQPATGGTWSWTGSDGFASTMREIDNIPLVAGVNTYTATYTVNGSSYKQIFTITVTPTYTIGGTVAGLTGTGLMLQDNGGNGLAISANGSYTFATPIASGGAYSVTVLTQPKGQTCSVSSGSGTATANVTNVAVTCAAATYTIGGTVTGLTGSGLVLTTNGFTLPVSANGNFTFATGINSGVSYSVAVGTQPSGETCSVSNGSGTVTANVTNVAVTCIPYYTISGTVTGLTGSGLVLTTNGFNLPVSANGNFTFATAINYGVSYSVAVGTQPSGETCSVGNGSGTVTANVTNVAVTCTSGYTIGGTVYNLTGTGLVLKNNLGNNLTVSGSGTVSFTFSNTVASGGAYSVTVSTQPAGQSCTVSNGSGTATANIANVQVGCIGEWAWMGGSKTDTQSGVYGAPGAAATSYIPGGREAAASWSDSSGNFWLFGGYGADSDGNQGNLNDLWKYNPSTKEWTYEAGSDTIPEEGDVLTYGAPGVYGTEYTPSYGNIPGGRYGASSWTDSSGNFWLFGGIGCDSMSICGFVSVCNEDSCTSVTQQGYGDLDDLWKFNPSTQDWTWMGGHSTLTGPLFLGVDAGVNEYEYYGWSGVYGIEGTAASANHPGGRDYAASWVDSNGNLWLFGGLGYGSTGNTGNPGYLNDLWEFNPSNHEWTWTGGSISIASCANGSEECTNAGVYGTQGTPATGNLPGGREEATTWTDSNGNFWLFGGYGVDSAGTIGSLKDLWEFDTTTKEWTWMGGSNTAQNTLGGGVYGTLGIPSATNLPNARVNAASWSGSNGNLWLFGGSTYNDLWELDSSTVEWTWMGGSIPSVQIVSGVYGTLGSFSLSNVPGERESSASWIDASGNLWLFGGAGDDSVGEYGYLNDLWEYKP